MSLCDRCSRNPTCVFAARYIAFHVCLCWFAPRFVRSVVVVLHVATLQAVYTRAPANTAEVIGTVCDHEVLIHILVALAVIIASSATSVVTFVHVPHWRGVHLLVESTIPVVVSLEHSRDIVSAYEDGLHTAVDSASLSQQSLCVRHRMTCRNIQVIIQR